MTAIYRATQEKRRYNRLVANETLEDFALRFTARRARRWSHARVANTAIGSISFLALEAIGAAITLTYGFDTAILAIMLVGLVLFVTAFPISYYAARYGVDIDLLTRGAGFGYIGSTITSLIYASFTFIFFALEAAILALALEFCFGIPLVIGYLLSAVVVIPLVINGFSRISTFQAWTQPLWVGLHVLPFALLAFVGYDLDGWAAYPGLDGASSEPARARLLMLGAASGVVFSLIAQVGEQVDYIRFLPEPRNAADRRRWWTALIAAGPGWTVLGVVKMLAGSYLAVLTLGQGLSPSEAADPTHMYHTAFAQVIDNPMAVLALTGVFVILSQLKINITNAYAGSIAWSNFFSRLTHAHPGRVVWLVFNVGIGVLLMELGVFGALEATLALYSHVALAWIGALVADLVVNKPLGLSPPGIEFRRAHLYDVNPVGIGAMAVACILSLAAYAGAFGDMAQAFSAGGALAVSFAMAPAIACATAGRYYIARPAPVVAAEACSICEYAFDPEDMTHCPFHAGPICSLCCTLDGSCQDACKPHARWESGLRRGLERVLPTHVVAALAAPLSRFLWSTALVAVLLGGLLATARSFRDAANFDAALTVTFGLLLIVAGVVIWTHILKGEGQRTARDEAERQTARLLAEIRAHERTDAALQRAKDAAEAANLAKTRYMSGLSHELRTPLNSIYGFAQILEKDPDMPPRRRNAVTTIRRSSEHLAGLIEGLLDISRIEAGRLEIAQDRIHLPSFLRQIAAIFEKAAQDKALAFEMTAASRLPDWITADEKRLRQILINLLSNAVRYTDKGQVALHISYRNEVASIEVVDTGCGIPEHERANIWKPFERGAAALSEPGGSGLGLTITKLLVEVLGGEIEVDSTPGQGSAFRVRLMLPSVSPRHLPPSPTEAASAPMPVRGYLGPRRRILVVDDDPNHLELVQQFLTPKGFELRVARDVDSARAALDGFVPDLFVLDIDLPGQDGWAFAAELRAADPHRATPIAMISGHAHETDHPGDDGRPLSDAFLAKPYNLDDLMLRISDLLRLRLVIAGTDPVEADTPPALPDDIRTELAALARDGRAGPLRTRLDALRQDGGADADVVARLIRHADVFDMAAILRCLDTPPAPEPERADARV